MRSPAGVGAARAETAVAAGVVVLGLVVLGSAAVIPATPLYAQVGPEVVPFAIGAGLLALGLALLWSAVTGRRRSDPEAATPVDWRGLAWLAAGFVLNIVLIGTAGFIVASTVLFVLAARGFASRAWLRDLAIGFAVALAAYLTFDRLLGIRVGAGIFEGIL